MIKLLPDDTVVVATNRLVLSLVHVFVQLTVIAYSLPKEGCRTQDRNYLIIFIIQLPDLDSRFPFDYLSFRRCLLAKQTFHKDTFPVGN